MALSNWDTLGFNKHGSSCHGIVVSAKDKPRCVRIYKNWVYLDDADGWEESSGYVHPVVGEMHEGRLMYKDFHIYVKRIEQQQAVFMFALSINRLADPTEYHWGGGIGCYGFDIDGKFIGVTPWTFEAWKAWILTEVVPVCYWLDKSDMQEWIKKCGQDPQRHNQGDRYLAGHTGLETPHTPVGSPEDPLMIQAIDKMGKE